jgi:phage tail protein X
MPQTITIAGDNLTLDLVLWRQYGVRGQSLVEETMERNPALVDAVLPIGAEVVLPDLPEETPARRDVVTLFG